jgi:hypothetical protein
VRSHSADDLELPKGRLRAYRDLLLYGKYVVCAQERVHRSDLNYNTRDVGSIKPKCRLIITLRHT